MKLLRVVKIQIDQAFIDVISIGKIYHSSDLSRLISPAEILGARNHNGCFKVHCHQIQCGYCDSNLYVAKRFHTGAVVSEATLCL